MICRYRILWLLLTGIGSTVHAQDNYNAYTQTNAHLYQLEQRFDWPIAQRQDSLFACVQQYLQENPETLHAHQLFTRLINLRYGQLTQLLSHQAFRSLTSLERTTQEYLLERVRVAETGSLFPGWTFATTSGDSLSTGSLPGKFVLIDCWASWCKPCRKQNAAWKALHQRYAADRLAIIGVSLDEKKKPWQQALKEDALPWPATAECVPLRQNRFARYFSIVYTPANFLLNPLGILVGQDLSPAQVEAILSGSKKGPE
jgi:thiol-disulfide isomerase/thioredoxin